MAQVGRFREMGMTCPHSILSLSTLRKNPGEQSWDAFVMALNRRCKNPPDGAHVALLPRSEAKTFLQIPLCQFLQILVPLCMEALGQALVPHVLTSVSASLTLGHVVDTHLLILKISNYLLILKISCVCSSVCYAFSSKELTFLLSQ